MDFDRPPPHRSTERARVARVLIIDDDHVIARVFARVLGQEYDVVTVNGAQDALARLGRGERFDAILSDVGMPGIDGLELCRRLWRDDRDHAARVVLMTAGPEADDVAHFHAAFPSTTILAKPIPIALLRSTIGGVVDGRRSAARGR